MPAAADCLPSPSGRAAAHPPLEGEGRIAEGDPGWGDSDAAFVARPGHPHPASSRGPTSPLQGEVFGYFCGCLKYLKSGGG